MFAGIVQGTGTVLERSDHDGDRELVIAYAGVDLGTLRPGDSIAVNGTCLTATACREDAFAADISAETLTVTTLEALGVGDRVNLESSLKLGDSLDGHLVYGHVDGVGQVVSLDEEGRSIRLLFEAPPGLARYIAVKGSVAIDGVSLTVNAVDGGRFAVNVIPHTREKTVISGYEVGTPVNIEVDIIARYLERLGQYSD